MSFKVLLEIGLIALRIGNSIFEEAKRRGIKLEGYTEALNEQAAATVRVTGINARSFGEVAGWTDSQVEDDLTRPPSPVSRP